MQTLANVKIKTIKELALIKYRLHFVRFWTFVTTWKIHLVINRWIKTSKIFYLSYLDFNEHSDCYDIIPDYKTLSFINIYK